jgi:hypothetical protein
MTLIEPVSRPMRLRRTGTLTGYALFHLNMMFSSIEESERPKVIQRCYDPLLDLAETGIKIAVEATGLTLEIVESLRPDWIARLRNLIAEGRVEFVGSSYAQAIGPLMPHRAISKNLELGLAVYQRLLGVRPRIALVNEQAWSGGLVPLYRAAGFTALVMDWDDPAAHHPEWNRHWRYHPQIARGADGSEIALLWSNTIAFQKLQRLAHGDIALDDYADFILGHRGPVDRVLALYTNDAECFGYRPSRFGTEDPVSDGEWGAVRAALQTLSSRGVTLAHPSEALQAARGGNAGNILTLEAPNNPVPVKKQPKYNITRWASSGRDDFAVNTACHQLYSALVETNATDDAWRTLLHLWSSDYRTHITETRWQKFRAELDAALASHPRGAQLETAIAPSMEAQRPPVVERGERFIFVETAELRVAFDKRRGLAITAMGRPNARALIGGLAHGEIDDITLSADWYTGNFVFEGPGEPKITDLEGCAPTIAIDETSGTVTLTVRHETPLGAVDKTIRIPADAPRIEIEQIFHWPNWGKGSLRLGHVTLKPDAFDTAELRYRTHNGGAVEDVFLLADTKVDLGQAVSFLISCRAGIGMTEGSLQIDDGANAVRLEADLSSAAVIGLVEHRVLHGQTFCRMMLSALEMDETRKPSREPSAPRTVRYAIALDRVNAP